MTSPASYDLCVIGGGSGGIGAALAASRMGLRVLLVEKGDCLGGNAVRGGVSNWEPGVGGTGFPFEIYRNLRKRPHSVYIGRGGRHCSLPVPGQPFYPGGELIPDPEGEYRSSLRRSADPPLLVDEMFGPKCRMRQVVFEPSAYAEVVESMLRETGHADLRLGCGFKHVQMDGEKVHAVELDDGSVVVASYFIDATADGLLCRAAGCEMLHGRDSRSAFNEPDAPEKASHEINGVTLMYRTAPAATPAPLPSETVDCWWRKHFPMAVITQAPAGGLIINMLPTMEGREFLKLGYPAAREECTRRVHAHWQWLQAGWEEFRNFTLAWIAPALGIREGARVRARAMLTEHDLLAGILRQTHQDIIALADHAMDRHGEGGGCRHLLQPYGIPYRCLLPVGLSNVAVASRAAGFSALAASSCRLSRTMMDLGHAAGTAAALACGSGIPLPEVDPENLRQALREQNAWVDWPMPDSLRTRLEKLPDLAKTARLANLPLQNPPT